MALLDSMSAKEFVRRRNAYSYPAVGLKVNTESCSWIEFDSTSKMDMYHALLLVSEEELKAVWGYLSTVFWGHFSGQDGRIRAARACAKVRMAVGSLHSLGVGNDEAAALIRMATKFVQADRYSRASQVLSELPQLGTAFASKVCAFLAPSRCGVVDRNIASKYPEFGFGVDEKGFVKRTAANFRLYDSYCAELQETAAALNSRGPDFRWSDRDGTLRTWRAVDVERAIF